MNLGLSELVLIMLVTIATLAVPALVLYLVFTAGRRRDRVEARRESPATGAEVDHPHG